MRRKCHATDQVRPAWNKYTSPSKVRNREYLKVFVKVRMSNSVTFFFPNKACLTGQVCLLAQDYRDTEYQGYVNPKMYKRPQAVAYSPSTLIIGSCPTRRQYPVHGARRRGPGASCQGLREKNRASVSGRIGSRRNGNSGVILVMNPERPRVRPWTRL